MTSIINKSWTLFYRKKIMFLFFKFFHLHGLCKYLNLHSWNVSNMFCLFLTSSNSEWRCVCEASVCWRLAEAEEAALHSADSLSLVFSAPSHRHPHNTDTGGAGDRRTHRHPSCWAIQLRLCFFHHKWKGHKSNYFAKNLHHGEVTIEPW